MRHLPFHIILELPPAAFREIRDKMAAAGYTDQFHEGDEGLVIDMTGIALQAADELEPENELEGEMDL